MTQIGLDHRMQMMTMTMMDILIHQRKVVVLHPLNASSLPNDLDGDGICDDSDDDIDGDGIDNVNETGLTNRNLTN